METNLSQSSCEIITEIKNLEVCSETENFSSQFSDIANEVTKLELKSSVADEIEKAEQQEPEGEKKAESSTSASSESSLSSESSSSEAEAPVKQKRKRKRKRKKKTSTTAYEPPRPFTSRYKKLKISPVLPKIHIRFDDIGDPDQLTSEYNIRPRIIEALKRNLTIEEGVKGCKEKLESQEEATKAKLCVEEALIVSLKPRIIRAIVV